MSVWRHLRHGLHTLLHRAAAERALAEEVDHWIEEATAELIRQGVPPGEARRRVRVGYGAPETARDEVRAYGWERTMGRLAGDLRYGARRLRRDPGFTVVAVGTLALGIGAATAVFTAARPVLLASLPYPDHERVVAIADRAADGAPIDVTFGTFLELARRSSSFDGLAPTRPWQPTLTGAAEPMWLTGQRVGADYFEVLGVGPVLGRGFHPADDRPDGARTVILSDGLWRARFGADSAVVGRSIRLDDEPFTVIGVMGPAFENVTQPAARVWTLLRYDRALPSFEGREWGHHLGLVGRLRTDVSIDAAARELDRIAAEPLPDRPRPAWAALENGLVVEPLGASVTRAMRPTVLALAGAAVLLLAIACVNVGNLLLGRGVRRREELAMRRALGAGQGRLVRQLVTEGLLLGALGGLGGAVVGTFGVRLLAALAPEALPRPGDAAADPAAFVFALVVTTVVGLSMGLLPALREARGDLGGALRGGGRRANGHRRVRAALVVAEVSVTLVLLVGAGLLLRSLDRLLAVDPGFRAEGVLAVQVQTSGQRFNDAAEVRRFFDGALEAVRSVPGVASAGLVSQLPLSGEADTYGVTDGEGGEGDPDSDGGAFRYVATPGAFEALGITRVGGRLLDDGDVAGAPGVVVVSASLARRRFGSADPIGRRVHVGSRTEPPYTVVGVVGDVKQVSLASDGAEAVWIATGQWYFADRVMWFVVRSRGDAAALAPAVRQAIWSVDPDQPIVRVTPVDDLLATSAAERRLALHTFRTFGLAALLLAAIGLYGVLSGSVAERMREMGVRSALGATRSDLLAMVLRQGLALTAVGALLGAGAAVLATEALDSLLFGVSRLDPPTWAGVLVLLGVIAVLACSLPAWRAARVEPSRTLRVD